MRVRLLTAVVVATALAIGAASAAARPAAPAKAQADPLTVWLMGDAQANWPEAVAAANAAFKQQHPGTDVNVQYQSWGDYKTKFEATLAGGSGPDVIEFGNTDVPKYSAAGALAPLTRSQFPNSRTWLSGPRRGGQLSTASSTRSRTTRAHARSSTAPTSTARPASGAPRRRSPSSDAAGLKLMKRYGGSKNPTYSAVYFPGRYWYAAMSFVYD